MKIEITAVPKFHLSLSYPDATFLSELAAMHYDATCKNAGRLGGFLYGWINHLTLADACEAADTTVDATWRELDICLKILENTGTDEQRDRASALRMAFRRAMDRASVLLGMWNSEDSRELRTP